MPSHFYVCEECDSKFRSQGAIEHLDEVECPTCGKRKLQALPDTQNAEKSRGTGACGTGWGGG
ncbi:MAG: hypothetical protein GY835_25580 [bacterium]|nr:hypothetical protein [bacterium]